MKRTFRWLFLVGILVISSAHFNTKGNQDSTAKINDVEWSQNKAETGMPIVYRNTPQPTVTDVPASALSPEDFRAAKYLNIGGSPNQDTVYREDLFEGDIENVSVEQLQIIRKGEVKNAITDTQKKWVGAVVPYIISSSFTQYERSVIAKAIQEYHEKTCIRFRPRTSEQDYIYIIRGPGGCSSSVGKMGGQQTVNLGTGCVFPGIVMHELMHAAGFWHEQSRNDRDDYIIVNWRNIRVGMESQFFKYDLNTITHLNADYDTCSVMHYGPYAFSKGTLPTITAKVKPKCDLGQRIGFSDTDIRKLNTFYQCTGYPQTGNSITKPQPAVTTPKPWVKPDCVDQNKYCATWAKMKECEKNPSWMLISCPVACDQCKLGCVNYNAYCEEWARSGECRKNPEYMDIYCAKACGNCKSDKNCDDENENCSNWARKGYCRSQYKDYMTLRCKKSCRIC